MIFYRTAASAKNWHGVFVNTATGETTVISNDARALRDYYEKSKEEIWAGYGKAGLRTLKAALRQSQGAIKIFAYNIASGGRNHSSELKKISKAGIAAGSERTAAKSGWETETAEICLKRGLAAAIEIFARDHAKYISKLGMLEKYGLPLEFIGKPKAAIAAAKLKNMALKRV